MILSRVRVRNYKSFADSGDISLDPGFTVLVGRNNSGKTAFLEAIGLRGNGRPHLSLATKPFSTSPVDPGSEITIDFDLTGGELREILVALSPFPVPVQTGADNDDSAMRQALVQHARLSTVWRGGDVLNARFNDWGVVANNANDGLMCFLYRASVTPEGTFSLTNTNRQRNQAPDTFPIILAKFLRDRIYSFQAERLSIGQSVATSSSDLAPNAVNLPQVLHTLQNEAPHRWHRYVSLVRAVFEDVTDVTAPTNSGGGTEIRVWSLSPETDRPDLAIPLSESGTGLGQVLAILYVVVTSRFPRVIIIDEPQSFLHPGAIRRLFTIFREFPEHQYIISSHSPVALAALSPLRVLVARKAGATTTLQVVESDEGEQLRATLHEVGARLSDVFGADAVLWVEGPTEEDCFPIILRSTGTPGFGGTAILAVHNTGDLSRKDVRSVVSIYRRLSSSTRLLPPMVALILDREMRTQEEQEQLRRESGGRIHFLPRRMYENYLLVPQAIASLASSIEGFRPEPVTAAEVGLWMDQNGTQPPFCAGHATYGDVDEAAWLRDVDGARLLGALFKELSENRVQYDKVRHGALLTRSIADANPNHFSEIVDLLVRVSQPSPPTQP